jgi:hypothetical protein
MLLLFFLSFCWLFGRIGKGMQLGGKGKSSDIVDSLIAESASAMPQPAAAPASSVSFALNYSRVWHEPY